MVGAPLDALLDALAGEVQDSGRLIAEVLQAAAHDRAAAVWSRTPDGWLRRVARIGGDRPGPDRVRGAEALRGLPDVAMVVPVVDGEVERGALTLCHLAGREPVNARELAQARDAAGYVALLLRGPQLEEQLRRRILEASRLSEALAASHERLSYAADLESRRMVADIIAFGGDELAGLRERVRRMQDDRRHLVGGPHSGEAAQAALVELRQVLDGLIDRLRTVVRGIYPHLLHDRGIRAALAELATGLPRALLLRGDLEGVPREVESGLYWPAAAVLQVLADGPATAPVTMALRADGQHATVTMVDPLSTSAAALRGVLPMAHDRLAALGGWLEHEAGTEGLVVRMALPAHLAPTVPATISTGIRSPDGPQGPDTGADLRSRVRRLVHVAAEVVDAQDRQELRRTLARLDQLHAAPGQVAALAGVPEALAVLDEVTRFDQDGWLRYEYDRLRSDAHDLDEVALMHQIRAGALALSRPDAQAALRLLGGHGSTVRARLGLAEAAGPAQLRATAAEQVARWRACAESGAAGPRERAAYRLLARSAEGLLVRIDGGRG
jgi:hypothetical protein